MLKNKLIVITRSASDSSAFAAKLLKKGAKVYKLPTIQIIPKKLGKKDLANFKNIEKFDYVIFTSSHAVSFFNKNLRKLKVSPAKLKNVKIVAVGPATAKSVKYPELKSKWTPERFNAAAIVRKISKNISGKKVLVPRSAIAPKDLIAALKAKGARVSEVFLYTIVPIKNKDPRFNKLLKTNKVDYITFTSPSSVFGFQFRIENDKLIKRALQLPVVCIGPTTGAAAKKFGFRKITVAKEYTTAGMMKALQKIA